MASLAYITCWHLAYHGSHLVCSTSMAVLHWESDCSLYMQCPQKIRPGVWQGEEMDDTGYAHCSSKSKRHPPHDAWPRSLNSTAYQYNWTSLCSKNANFPQKNTTSEATSRLCSSFLLLLLPPGNPILCVLLVRSHTAWGCRRGRGSVAACSWCRRSRGGRRSLALLHLPVGDPLRQATCTGEGRSECQLQAAGKKGQGRARWGHAHDQPEICTAHACRMPSLNMHAWGLACSLNTPAGPLFCWLGLEQRGRRGQLGR